MVKYTLTFFEWSVSIVRKKMVKVTFENGTEIMVEPETRVIDAIRLANIKTDEEILAVKINNKERSILYHLIEDSKCDFITFSTREGERIYSRSLKFIFLMALHRLNINLHFKFLNKTGRDYFAFVKEGEVTTNLVKEIKSEMKKIISENIRIMKEKGSSRRIANYLENRDQVQNIVELNLNENYTVYYADDFYTYLYGSVVMYTGCIKGFDLRKYKNGVILMLPEKDNIEKVKYDIETNRMFELSNKFSEVCKVTSVESVNDLNRKIVDDKIDTVIRRAELYHTNEFFEISKRIVRTKKVKIVMLAGPSSSGKTTSAQRLADTLMVKKKNAIVISMDNYFKDEGNIPIGEDGKEDYECFENIEIDLFKKQMLDLLRGKKVILPTFNFKLQKKEFINAPIKLKENDILIIEGIHALNPKASEFIPKDKVFKLYVAPMVSIRFDPFTMLSSNDLRLMRRFVRDNSTRGVSVEKTMDLWEKIRQGDEKNIFPFVDRADYILNTSLIYEWAALKPTVEKLLLKINNSSIYYSEARRLLNILRNFIGIETDLIPSTSILREFIGGGCYLR